MNDKNRMRLANLSLSPNDSILASIKSKPVKTKKANAFFEKNSKSKLDALTELTFGDF